MGCCGWFNSLADCLVNALVGLFYGGWCDVFMIVVCGVVLVVLVFWVVWWYYVGFGGFWCYCLCAWFGCCLSRFALRVCFVLWMVAFVWVASFGVLSR